MKKSEDYKVMNSSQGFIEEMDEWGWSINARKNFNKFIDAIDTIDTEDGLITEIQKVQFIIDDIVLKAEQ